MGWRHRLQERLAGMHEAFHEGHMEYHMGRGGRGHGRHRGHGWFGHGGGNPFGGNPFGGNPFGGNPFARRMRVKRGDVRAAILVLLAEEPRNGYQIMQELEKRSSGMWRPSPGSIYPAFQQLEDEGLIKAEDSGTGKVYRLTDAGQTAAKKATEGKAPWESIGDDEEEDDSRASLFHQMKQIGLACLQIAHAGDKAQTEEAARVLSDARKALYTILAEDTEE